MDIKSYRIYFVNTRHVLPRDLVLLEQLGDHAFADVNVGIEERMTGGFLLWIGDEGLEEEDATLLQNRGFSPEFAALLLLVYEEAQRYCLLLLDSAADEIDGLQTFTH
jgi:hypothetical protein